MDTLEYRKQQIKNAEDTHDNDFEYSIKIVGSHDSTKFMNITKTELEQIKSVLLDYRIETK